MSSEWHDGGVTSNEASQQEGPRFDLDSGKISESMALRCL